MAKKLLMLCLAAAFGWLAPNVHAALFSLGFSGEITIVDNRFGGVPSGIAVGDPFTVTYTFESTTPDVDVLDPQRGFYRDTLSNVSFILNGQAFSFTPRPDGVGGPANVGNVIDVRDNLIDGRTDFYQVSAQSPFGSGDFLTVQIQMQERRLPGQPLPDVFTSDALPLTIDPSQFTSRRLFAVDFAHNSSFDGRVEGNISGIPEPSTWVMLLAGLGVLGWIGRRRIGR